MATLDDDFGYIDPATVSPWSTAIRYGGIGSAILVIFGLLVYVTGIIDYEALGAGESTTMSWISNLLNYGVTTGAIVMAIKYHKEKQLGGYLSFGRGFYTGFATIVIMGLIGAVWTYLFFGLVAPDVLEIMKEGAMAQMDEAQAEAAGSMMDMMMSPASMALFMFFGSLVFGVLVSLIASAVLKKEHTTMA
jgi:Protein of unknown function (DUF4199)